MIKAAYDNETGKILLISSGEHQRVGAVFANNGHLRDKWYHAPIADHDFGVAMAVRPLKVMDITEDWGTVVSLFTNEGAMSIVDEILDAVGDYNIMHPPAPVNTSSEPVTGQIVFSQRQ